MYIGIDLGTSGVKAILLNEQGEVVASHTEKLTVSRPHPLWSEQDPEQWWLATDTAMKALGAQHSLRDVKALGIAGQMHGATLLDKSLQVLRPAILWNDGRCAEECQLLEEKVSASRQITGNLMMPGFTAPKLLWVQRHEAAVFNQVDKVLLPKDYLRLRMTGELASDMSDAAGTMWLDVARRDWSDEMLAACDLSRDAMPALFEGSDVTGQLRPEVAQAWNMPQALVVGGGGDNAAGAVGVGMADAGQAMLSLGTSGVYFAVSEGFLSKPESAVHSFCHALPGRWHLMSVMLSAASCLDWAAKLTGLASVPALIAAAQTADESAGPVWFLPYLSGERTPHNNPQAKGVFFGLTHQHGPAELARAVLELKQAGNEIQNIGTRHGEKLFEVLVTAEEMLRAEDLPGFFRIRADNRDLNYDNYFSKGNPAFNGAEQYNSHNTHRLDVEEMKALLRKLKLFGGSC